MQETCIGSLAPLGEELYRGIFPSSVNDTSATRRNNIFAAMSHLEISFERIGACQLRRCG